MNRVAPSPSSVSDVDSEKGEDAPVPFNESESTFHSCNQALHPNFRLPVKLWKMHGGTEDVEEEFQAEATKESDIEPTKVGKKLNEMTTRKLIIMILGTVMVLPYLDISGWATEVDDFYVVNELENVWNTVSSDMTLPQENLMLDTFVSGVDKLLYVKMCHMGLENSNSSCTEHFPDPKYPSLSVIADKLRGRMKPRADKNVVQYQEVIPEASCLDPQDSDTCNALAITYVDYSEKSILNIIKTVIVMGIIVYGTLNFQRDAQSLVLTPINRMVNVVHTLSENPLANTSALQDLTRLDSKENSETENYETILLEKTILKIGSLLQIGFGAAGASIIGKNMKAGALNPMVPGKMIISIYGFCDIRKFTDTTECLQEEVMVYVNKLGYIVHGCTNDYYGMANKNVGDAFLLSWKICDDLLPGFNAFEETPDDNIRLRACETVTCLVKGTGTVERKITPTEMADSALAAFLKCLVDLENANTNGSLTEYLSYPRVVKRFGPDFRIKMGFGMHVGWAIEGGEKRSSNASMEARPFFTAVNIFSFLSSLSLSRHSHRLPLQDRRHLHVPSRGDERQARGWQQDLRRPHQHQPLAARPPEPRGQEVPQAPRQDPRQGLPHTHDGVHLRRVQLPQGLYEN